MPDERDNPFSYLPYLGMKMPDSPLHPFWIPNRWVSGYDWATKKPYRHTPIHCGRSGGRPTEHTPVPLTATFHKWYH